MSEDDSLILFTPAALLDLLSQIDELKSIDVGITETLDGLLQLQVGNSTYIIDATSATRVSVDSSVLDTVDDANMQAYEELASSGNIELNTLNPISSGVLKELAKTLLVGGMVRLSAKLLK